MIKYYYCSRCGFYKTNSVYPFECVEDFIYNRPKHPDSICKECEKLLNKKGTIKFLLFKKSECTDVVTFETEYANSYKIYEKLYPDKITKENSKDVDNYYRYSYLCEDHPISELQEIVDDINYQKQQFDIEYQKFFDEVLSKNPMFDPVMREYIINKRQEDAVAAEKRRVQREKELHEKTQARKAYEAAHPKPKCPTCGSTNVEKISTLNRAVSIGIVGLASDKIGKQFQCKNCGYKW